MKRAPGGSATGGSPSSLTVCSGPRRRTFIAIVPSNDLMPNHVHLIAVAESGDGLRLAIGEVHRSCLETNAPWSGNRGLNGGAGSSSDRSSRSSHLPTRGGESLDISRNKLFRLLNSAPACKPAAYTPPVSLGLRRQPGARAITPTRFVGLVGLARSKSRTASGIFCLRFFGRVGNLMIAKTGLHSRCLDTRHIERKCDHGFH